MKKTMKYTLNDYVSHFGDQSECVDHDTENGPHFRNYSFTSYFGL